jgi:hypothetical protein
MSDFAMSDEGCFEMAGLHSRRKSNDCNAALAAEGMLRTYANLP